MINKMHSTQSPLSRWVMKSHVSPWDVHCTSFVWHTTYVLITSKYVSIDLTNFQNILFLLNSLLGIANNKNDHFLNPALLNIIKVSKYRIIPISSTALLCFQSKTVEWQIFRDNPSGNGSEALFMLHDSWIQLTYFKDYLWFPIGNCLMYILLCDSPQMVYSTRTHRK